MNFRIYSHGIQNCRRVMTFLGEFRAIPVSESGLYHKLIVPADIFAGAVLNGDRVEILIGLDWE